MNLLHPGHQKVPRKFLDLGNNGVEILVPCLVYTLNQVNKMMFEVLRSKISERGRVSRQDYGHVYRGFIPWLGEQL